MHREINFDGLIGPTHNYGGLSLGNRASAANAGASARPRAAALEGLAKMRACMDLGLAQGFLPPQPRPHIGLLRSLGFTGATPAHILAAAHAADPALLANATSASAMWAANAATVSPGPDTPDGRVHLSTANLSAHLHRSIEAPATHATLATVFPNRVHFALHAPLPAPLGDEGAANHMRMGAHHGAPAANIFVYGERTPGDPPARQHRAASAAVARRHGLDPARVHLARQSPAAIAAGAFHNDVVAVANETVLLAHEHAFADPAALHAFIAATVPGATILTVPAARVSLADAVASYLFNSQLVTLPDGGGAMALILPREAQTCAPVWAWLTELVGGNGPVRALHVHDVRESMRNGGGPACLRLRVVVTPEQHAAIDPRFILEAAKHEALVRLVEAHWPETIAPSDLGHSDLWGAAAHAHAALIAHLGLPPTPRDD